MGKNEKGEVMNILLYYKQGGDLTRPKSMRDSMKATYTDWVGRLDNEYYKKGNRVGRDMLFRKFKFEDPINHPSKRFVNAWLKNQLTNQIWRQSIKAKTIQAIITSRPNELIQVDYIYMLKGGANQYVVKEKTKPKSMSDKEWAQNLVDVSEENKSLESLKLNKVMYKGAITAVDAFSRRGYARAVKGNINSEKAFDVVYSNKRSIVKEAEDWVDAKPHKGNKHLVDKLQTDKGSEFMLNFREGLKDTKIRHVFGYEGRSVAQALVERFNGTLKRIIKQLITNEDGTLDMLHWKKKLALSVNIYNNNIHSTIMRSPNSVGDIPNDLVTVKQSILNYAKKHKAYTSTPLKQGDYVRIYLYNHKKNEPSFTFKNGPLILMDPNRNEKFGGIYMIHNVNKGNVGKVGKSATYTIVAQWVHEKNLQPSSVIKHVDGNKQFGAETITVDFGDKFDSVDYPPGSYKRKFLINELIKVEKDEKGIPLVDYKSSELTDPQSEEEEVVSEDEDTAPIAKRTRGAESRKEYEVEKFVSYRKSDGKIRVRWKGYKSADDTYESPAPMRRALGAEAFNKFNEQLTR